MRRSVLFEAALVLLLIALVSLLYLAVTSGPRHEGWTVSGIIAAPPADYFMMPDYFGNMFVGENGTLYTIDGQRLHAISGNGSLLWSLEIPDIYTIYVRGRDRNWSYGGVAVSPVEQWGSKSAVIKDGHMYLIVKPEQQASINGVLLSVTPDGKIQWSIPFIGSGGDPHLLLNGIGDPDGALLHGDVLYVYSKWWGLSLININGTITCLIEGIEGKPAIGNDGTIYAIKRPQGPGSYNSSHSGKTVDAYLSDGTLIWSRGYYEFDINLSFMSMSVLDNQPYYRNGTIYVWSNDGFIALSENGSLKFRYRLPEGRLVGCGFGQNDTIFISYVRGDDLQLPKNESGIVILSPDGKTIKTQYSNDYRYRLNGIQDLAGGLAVQVTSVLPHGINKTNASDIYATRFAGMIIERLKNHSGKWDFPRGLYDLDTYELRAYDLWTGEETWTRTIPLEKRSVVLTHENAGEITIDAAEIGKVNKVPCDQWYSSNGIPEGSTGIKSLSWAFSTIGDDMVYVNMWSYNYEYPPFYNRSRCVYSGGVYAFSYNGTPVWSVSTDSRVVSVQEHNGTIYYGTGGGNVSAVRAGALAGVLTAAAYLFFRFFFFGVVSRARAKVDKNENRNRIVRYVAANPGASTFDVSRDLAINPGTVRYHLLVLSLNHRILSFRADEKYVRYFTNSGTYGPKDQLVISLMRRGPLRKIISTLKARPGLSNMELSRDLGVPKSATLRNVKELVDKGIIVKSLQPDGKVAYTLSDEYMSHTALAFELLAEKRRL